MLPIVKLEEVLAINDNHNKPLYYPMQPLWSYNHVISIFKKSRYSLRGSKNIKKILVTGCEPRKPNVSLPLICREMCFDLKKPRNSKNGPNFKISGKYRVNDMLKMHWHHYYSIKKWFSSQYVVLTWPNKLWRATSV